MNELQPDILHCIGNTSLLALRNIVPANGARILLKLESENPTGSMKDRMAIAISMVFRLAREEGLFAGTSTGANVIAALRLAEQLGPAATIVTVMCDTGMKYLRTYGAKLNS